MLEEIPLISGKAAVFGLIGLIIMFYLTKRPTVAIVCGIFAAGISVLF